MSSRFSSGAHQDLNLVSDLQQKLLKDDETRCYKPRLEPFLCPATKIVTRRFTNDVIQLQGGSEIRTSLDFEWSKTVWVANGLDFEWHLQSRSPTI